MKEAHTYHGHSIDLDLHRFADGNVRWTYFIDSDYCMQGLLADCDIRTARQHAVTLAERSIETLETLVRTSKRSGCEHAVAP